MKLYENIYAVSRDYGKFVQNSDRRKCLGLYDGDTGKAIPEGNYYSYLKTIEEKFNYYWTGHYLLPADKTRATPVELPASDSETPIFGGYIDSHMGHFFIEVLARGIDFNSYKKHPIIFLLLRNRADLTVFFRYCAFFGLDKNHIIIVDAPVIIPKLLIPEPQFYITEQRIKKIGESEYAYINPNLSDMHIPAKYFSDKFLEIHRKKGDTITLEENTIDKILYLSCIKSKLYFGEKIVHRVLEEQGHSVICPEEHSWETVISMVRKHKHIVGLRGSAMHFLMFCRKKKKVTYYANTDELSHNFYNLEQMLQNEMDYTQVRLTGITDRPETENLFIFDDIVLLLKKLGIDGLHHSYHDVYEQIITQNHIRHWEQH